MSSEHRTLHSTRAYFCGMRIWLEDGDATGYVEAQRNLVGWFERLYEKAMSHAVREHTDDD